MSSLRRNRTSAKAVVLPKEARTFLKGFYVPIGLSTSQLLARGYMQLSFERSGERLLGIRIAPTKEGREYLEKLALAYEKLQERKRVWLKYIRSHLFSFQEIRSRDSGAVLVFSVRYCKLMYSFLSYEYSCFGEFQLRCGRVIVKLPRSLEECCARKVLETLTPMLELKLRFQLGNKFDALKHELQNIASGRRKC